MRCVAGVVASAWQLLGSLRTVELILALSKKLGIEIPPAELDREQLAIRRRVAAYIEDKTP